MDILIIALFVLCILSGPALMTVVIYRTSKIYSECVDFQKECKNLLKEIKKLSNER